MSYPMPLCPLVQDKTAEHFNAVIYKSASDILPSLYEKKLSLWEHGHPCPCLMFAQAYGLRTQ